MTLLLAVAVTPLLVAYVVACLRDPLRWAMPPYAVLIPFSSLLSVAPGPFGSVSTLLGLLLGVALVFQLLTNRRGSASLPAAVPVWLAFLALSGLTLFWSVAPRVTADDFLILASQVLLFVAIVLTRFDTTTLRRLETALVLGGVLIVLYGLAQLTLLGGLPGRQDGGGAARFGDDLLGANNQAAALLLPLAIAAARTLTGSRNSRLLHGAAALLIIFGILMTGSRGGLLATCVVLLAVLVLGPARAATKVSLAAAAAVVLLVVLVANPGGFGVRQLEREGSSGRTDIWAVGAHACQLYCLTGAGWGGFPVVYQQELAAVPEARIQERGTTFEPHNIFLLAAVETGILGLVLATLGLVLALRSALRLPKAMRAPPAAAIAATLVSSFFLSNLGYKFFWAVLIYVAVSETVAAASRRSGRTLSTLPRISVPTGQGPS
jgi:O-antigen ligase